MIAQRKRPVIRVGPRLAGLPPELPMSVQNPTIKGTTISEDALRQKLGVEKPESKPKIPGSYRQFLNLDPQDIINFFDVKVGEYAEFAQVDSVVAPSMLEHRIARLQKVIACSKQIIEGLSVRIIKIRRGKDDALLDDKASREKYKREENARIARSNAKLFRYRTALRQGGYIEKVWRWVTRSVYFRDVVEDGIYVETVVDTTFIEGEDHNPIQVEEFKRDYYDLERYKTILKLNEESLLELGDTTDEMKESWRNFKRWENAIIRAAVFHRVITPRRDLAELLGLGAVLDEDDNPIEPDTTEDALAIKTGGRCYGGRIKGEGYRYREGKTIQRALSSFDKPLRVMKGNDSAGYDDTGFGSLRGINDDVESYDPR